MRSHSSLCFFFTQYGMNEATHLPKSEKPEEIQVDTDWIKPGSAKDRQDLIKLLVEKGANVNLLDFHDTSPLHYACTWGWLETVKLFLSEGADINQVRLAAAARARARVQRTLSLSPDRST